MIIKQIKSANSMQIERKVKPNNSYGGNFQLRPSRFAKNLTKIARKKTLPVFDKFSERNSSKL